MTGSDAEIQAVLDAGAARSARYGEGHRELWAALCGAAQGGKRFRPALAAAAHDALGGAAPVQVDRVGAALELLHTAFVVHDDVIDGDRVRRGRPNVSGTFTSEARRRGAGEAAARNYGDAAGILAGDLALVTATRMIARCGAPDHVLDALLELLEDAVHASAAGELADVGHSLPLDGPSTDVADAVRVAELKTAVYSFRLPLQAGAVLAGAPPSTVEALAPVGRDLGIGFQLLDDLLGVFGDPSRTGKSALTDLREGKPTALLAHARSTGAWAQLSTLVGDPGLDHGGAERARTLLTGCGARDRVATLAEDFLEEALRAAGQSPTTRRLGEVLGGIVGEIREAADSALVPVAASTQGASTQGASTQGASTQGASTQAASPQAASPRPAARQPGRTARTASTSPAAGSLAVPR